MKFIVLMNGNGLGDGCAWEFVDANDITQAKSRAFRDIPYLSALGSPQCASSVSIFGLNGMNADMIECRDFYEALVEAKSGIKKTESEERAEYERLRQKFGEA